MAATTPAPMAAPAFLSPAARRRPRPKRWLTALKEFAASLLGEKAGCVLARQPRRRLRRTPHAIRATCRVRAIARQGAQRQRQFVRHAALGRLQRAGLSRRGEQIHRRTENSEKRAGRRRRPCRQPDAVPRPDRGRRRAIAGRCALRGNGDRRQAAASSIPNSATIICRPLPTSPAPKCCSPIRRIRWGRWAQNR